MNWGLRVLFGVSALMLLGAGCHAALGLDDLELVDETAPPANEPGVPGVDMVSAGAIVESPSYRMVFTLGQSSPHQGTSESASYHHRGGLVGAVAEDPK